MIDHLTSHQQVGYLTNISYPVKMFGKGLIHWELWIIGSLIECNTSKSFVFMLGSVLGCIIIACLSWLSQKLEQTEWITFNFRFRESNPTGFPFVLPHISFNYCIAVQLTISSRLNILIIQLRFLKRKLTVGEQLDKRKTTFNYG